MIFTHFVKYLDFIVGSFDSKNVNRCSFHTSSMRYVMNGDGNCRMNVQESNYDNGEIFSQKMRET